MYFSPHFNISFILKALQLQHFNISLIFMNFSFFFHTILILNYFIYFIYKTDNLINILKIIKFSYVIMFMLCCVSLCSVILCHDVLCVVQ